MPDDQTALRVLQQRLIPKKVAEGETGPGLGFFLLGDSAPVKLGGGYIAQKEGMQMTDQNIERDRMDIICLIDRNATMKDSSEEVINLFNDWLQHYQDSGIKSRLSVVLVGENQEWLTWNMPLEYAKPLTEEVYQTLGNAALNDGIGKVLTKVIDTQRTEGYTERPTAVVTITNARENWSKDWTLPKVQDLVKLQEARGWEFTHLMLNPIGQQFDTPRTKTMFEIGALLDIVCVLDRSGSMFGSENEVIEGFNTFIAKQKEARPSLVTLVQFDHEYEVVYDSMPVAEVPLLTKDKYCPRGSTALYDALGRVLSSRRPSEEEKVNRVLLIITDGGENASHEFTQEKVSTLISEQEDHGAKVLYIGANVQEAEAIQIASRMHNAPCITQSKAVYAANYSCPVPNIQSFVQPSVTCRGGVEALGGNIGAAFNACDETCSTFPVVQQVNDHTQTPGGFTTDRT